MTAVSASVDVYFDYLCPYAWRGAETAELAACELGVDFRWRHFSVLQARYGGEAQGHLWNRRLEPDDRSGGRGLLPFLASLAARRQGPEAFDRFRLALLRARHRDGLPFDLATVNAVAEASGMHGPCFERDLHDPEARTALAREHCEAVHAEVRGTPTFVFPGGHGACVRIRELPQDRAEAARLLATVLDLLAGQPQLEAVMRTRRRCN